ncbi:MAG: hypothetical protein ACRC3Z_11145 [Phocaeicola sp.]
MSTILLSTVVATIAFSSCSTVRNRHAGYSRQELDSLLYSGITLAIDKLSSERTLQLHQQQTIKRVTTTYDTTKEANPETGLPPVQSIQEECTETKSEANVSESSEKSSLHFKEEEEKSGMQINEDLTSTDESNTVVLEEVENSISKAIIILAIVISLIIGISIYVRSNSSK